MTHIESNLPIKANINDVASLTGLPTRREPIPAMRLVQSSRFAQRLATWVLIALGLSLIGMLMLPWQQSAKGSGKVVAFVPQERQQSVESPIKGVVARIADGLVEGSRVKQGQFVLEIQPQAASLLEQLKSQIQDYRSKLATTEAKVEAYAQNIEGFTEARDAAVQAAQEMVQAAEAKLTAKRELIAGYEAKKWQAEANLARQQRLADQGIQSTKELEKFQKDEKVAVSELASIHEEVESLLQELASKRSELNAKRSEAQTKVDYARAMHQGALGESHTIRKELRDLEIKLEELDRLIITAPRDGTIFRMPVYERGQTLKEGDSLFTIVPDNGQPAVEMWVRGNDAPLIHPGDHVRLQFEGWPALQFAGWPSVAVGTFGGEVASVDATDNGKGRFRVLVREPHPHEWPDESYLRQGVRANGWVMLQRVSIGYEIWRQLNGFPPVIASEEPDDKDKTEGDDKTKEKKLKLPK